MKFKCVLISFLTITTFSLAFSSDTFDEAGSRSSNSSVSPRGRDFREAGSGSSNSSVSPRGRDFREAGSTFVVASGSGADCTDHEILWFRAPVVGLLSGIHAHTELEHAASFAVEVDKPVRKSESKPAAACLAGVSFLGVQDDETSECGEDMSPIDIIINNETDVNLDWVGYKLKSGKVCAEFPAPKEIKARTFGRFRASSRPFESFGAEGSVGYRASDGSFTMFLYWNNPGYTTEGGYKFESLEVSKTLCSGRVVNNECIEFTVTNRDAV